MIKEKLDILSDIIGVNNDDKKRKHYWFLAYFLQRNILMK